MSTSQSSSKPDMRRHQRILVSNGHVILVSASDQEERVKLDGVVTVIGLGGMFFRTTDSRPAGTILHLRLADSIVTFESECTVRSVASNGLGVEFTQITPENELKLKSLLYAMKH
jgi:PilZ domain